MTRPVRIGFVSAGMMAQVGHLPFYLDDPRCEVVGIVESRPSLIEALSPVVGAEVFVDDHRALFARDDVDAVVLCTPRPATGPVTLEALAAGKHVLAEKPMAHTAEQAETLVRQAEASGVHYSVGYMKRFDPGIETAARTLARTRETGSMGALLAARIYDYSKSYAMTPPAHTRPRESRQVRFDTWPLWPDWLPERFREAYAWFLNAGCHDVNLMHLFLPDVDRLVGATVHPDGGVAATLEAGGVPVQLEVTKTAAGRWIEGGEFLFESGRIRFDVPSPMATGETTRVLLDDGTAGRADVPVDTGTSWSFARQAEGFVDALCGTAPVRNAGREALLDMRLIEAIWKVGTASNAV
jgi:predicted dehydrogenase